MEKARGAQDTLMLATKFDYITQAGIEQGIEQGKSEALKETVLKFLRQGLLTEHQIADALDLPLEQIQAIKAQSTL